MFALAGNSNKPIVGPTSRPGIYHEQWCHLWRSGFRYYLCPDLIVANKPKEVIGKAQWIIESWNVGAWSGSRLSLPAAFVEVWRVWYCCVLADWHIPYILKSNPHPFYSFRGLENQTQIRIACGLDFQSWAEFWKNDRAAVRAVRSTQYNNLLFIILYGIYNLLFIRLAVITHNWIIIHRPVTIVIFTIVLP